MHARKKDAEEEGGKASFYIRLYTRCKEYGVLPGAGGILDQKPGIMRILDIVSAEVDEEQRRAKKVKDVRRENLEFLLGMNARRGRGL